MLSWTVQLTFMIAVALEARMTELPCVLLHMTEMYSRNYRS